MIRKVLDKEKLIAIIVPHTVEEEGIHVFTSDDLSQQLAYMKHPPGKSIPPHVHNPVSREVLFTQEVLFIKSGSLRVDFYGDERNYLESQVLEAGDVILLVTGGHGFEALEEVEMIEVKQGPYTGDADKTRFIGIERSRVTIKT